MKQNTKKYRFGLMLLMVVSALVLCWSCREDDEPDMSQPLSLVIVNRDQVVVETRADITKDGKDFSYFNDPSYNIGVFLPPSRANNMGIFKYDDKSQKWLTDQRVSSVRVDPGVDYDIYGFMPVGIAKSASVSGYTRTYPHGLDYPHLLLNEISAVTNKDLCVIVGLGDTKELAQIGRFGYTGKTGDEENKNTVFLLMQRLYAGFNFKFKIGDEYDKVRTIKVRSIELESESFSKVDIDVTFNSYGENENLPVSGANPINEILYSKTEGKSTTSLFDATADDSEVYTLDKSSWWEVPGFFTPSSGDQTFKLIVEYDVYDKNGNLVRPECHAENMFAMPSPVAGTQYVINVEVKPTYLYQLSDTDLDNPGITITKN